MKELEMAGRVETRGISKVYQTRRGLTEALRDITLDVLPGQFVCLFGPSGCGKSTLLSLIAGLEQPSAGELLVDDSPVTEPGRDRVMMFQDAALFPWLNVHDNIGFGLRSVGLSRAEQNERVMHYVKLVGLTGFERAYAHELSGGMRQRASLARALALDPPILLMDEPFAALDAMTRDSLHDELQGIWQQTNKTILFVTHNVREALVLGDRILLMSARPGRIKRDYRSGLPRPRHIEDHALVDAARDLLDDLRREVLDANHETPGISPGH
jgi:NitT/TauT family transport system ATP-binding protein